MPKDSKTETIFHNFSAQEMPNREDQDMIVAATKIAKSIKHTNPYQSDYHVKAVAMGDFARFATGGNREKTLSDAWIHGETSAINNFRGRFGDAAIRVISFWNPETNLDILRSSSPCGPCRDTLRQELSLDTIITEGNDEVIAIKRLSDYLKETFRTVNRGGVNPNAVKAARYALSQATNEYLPSGMQDMLYGVSLLDRHNRTWRGALHTTSGYNEVSPGYLAVTNWRDSLQPGEKRSDIDRITVVRQGALPTNIEYRDRQALLEFDEILMAKFGRAAHTWVDLVHIDENGTPVEVARTDTLEWLPSPFSASALGLPVPEQQAEKLTLFENQV